MFQGIPRPIAHAVNAVGLLFSGKPVTNEPIHSGQEADPAISADSGLALQAPVSLSALIGSDKYRDFDLAQGPVRISRGGNGFQVIRNTPLNQDRTFQRHVIDCYDQNSHFVLGVTELWELSQYRGATRYELASLGSGHNRQEHNSPEIDISELHDL